MGIETIVAITIFAIAGALFAALVGFVIGYDLSVFIQRTNAQNRGAPEPEVDYWFASNNALCIKKGADESSCATILTLVVANREEADPFQIRIASLKTGDDNPQYITTETAIRPVWSESFSANNTSLFYDGSGTYRVIVYLIRDDEVIDLKGLTIQVTDSDRPLVPLWTIANRQFTQGFKQEFMLSKVSNEKATIRCCKGMALIRLSMGNTQFFPPAGSLPDDLDQVTIEQWRESEDTYAFDPTATQNMGLVMTMDGNEVWRGEISYDGTINFGPPLAGGSANNPSVTPTPLIIGEEMTITVSANFSTLDAPPAAWVSANLFPVLACPSLVTSIPSA